MSGVTQEAERMTTNDIITIDKIISAEATRSRDSYNQLRLSTPNDMSFNDPDYWSLKNSKEWVNSVESAYIAFLNYEW